ncbi:MAG: alpha/beta fold hydrolase [Pyrinomonadaceae bacterium]|nr:alpha/beta fold hydrolase [Pyrinomonadaceae bacterium]MCX7639519.1 alpha/beta fold hydrolase [Pyrinomonadaceae bacterium]MDW8304430.1 alpha/beta fold hydrolase [Acidobacteriota bacterium]
MYPKGNLFIPAPHGRLEAILKEPKQETKGAALIAHPHPLGGGTMHNKVVFRTASAFLEAGFAALRFNFRGVGLSTGMHDHGQGEKEDVSTALSYLAKRYPNKNIIFAGFSFGSRFGLEAVYEDSKIKALISIGTPVDKYDYSFLLNCNKPILFIHGDKDEFGSLENLQKLYLSLPCPKKLVVFENCGHFFDNHLDKLKETIKDWLNNELTT